MQFIAPSVITSGVFQSNVHELDLQLCNEQIQSIWVRTLNEGHQKDKNALRISCDRQFAIEDSWSRS